MSDTAANLGFTPRTFALRASPHGDTAAVIGWGMTLPDGSAVAVDWRNGASCLVAICGSAERAARLQGADLIWVDQPAGHPATAGRPP